MENFLDKIAELELLIAGVRKENSELEISNALKVKEVLEGYFNPFKEFDIQVSRGSAYFHAKDEDGRNRELFSLSFYERYKEDPRLELSYYTTSTQSEFELDRLISLGTVARIVKTRSEIILRDIISVKNSDAERSNQLYSIVNGYEKEIVEYRRGETFRRKLRIELDLRNDGIVFDQNVYIEFKRSYAIKVKSLKMIDFSKSGKTCTVIYSTRDGFQTREENCNVENILNQAVYFHDNIVEGVVTLTV